MCYSIICGPLKSFLNSNEKQQLIFVCQREMHLQGIFSFQIECEILLVFGFSQKKNHTFFLMKTEKNRNSPFSKCGRAKKSLTFFFHCYHLAHWKRIFWITLLLQIFYSKREKNQTAYPFLTEDRFTFLEYLPVLFSIQCRWPQKTTHHTA